MTDWTGGATGAISGASTGATIGSVIPGVGTAIGAHMRPTEPVRSSQNTNITFRSI